jgi:hypothetical protein
MLRCVRSVSETGSEEQAMMHFRSVLRRGRSNRVIAGVVAVGLGAATWFVVTDANPQPRGRARPVADIVNPWAAGDAAIQRLLDDCVAIRRNGWDHDPLAVYRDVVTRRPECGMFPPRRILAASPARDE